MVREFPTIAGRARWSADADGLDLTAGRRRWRLRWAEITRAGLIHLPAPDLQAGFPTRILPGLGRLFAIGRSLERDYRQLALARGRSSWRMVRVAVPLGDPEANALVEEVAGRLGSRWVGEIPMASHYRALGVAYPWLVIPLFVILLVGAIPGFILAAGTFIALQQGKLGEIPPAGWAALAVWLAILGAIFYIYRGRA